MKKVFDKILEWVKQHKKAAIGAGAGSVVLIAAIVAAVIGITGTVTTGGRSSGGGITRGEWIKLYGEKFNIVSYEQSEPYYSDVDSNNEAFAYVQAFVENEIMSGEGEAKLGENVTFEEALVQLAKYYGDNYIKGAVGKDELTDTDRLEFLKNDAEISIENTSKALSEENANELLDLVWSNYLNREFVNTNEINYAENVIDLSSVKEYKYADNKLVIRADADIAEGKVLVLGESDEYIAGLAVKVTKVSKENGIYTLEVIEPKLDEIVDSFYLSTSQLVDFEGFEPEEGVTVEEVGTQTAKIEKLPVPTAVSYDIIKADRNELLSIKFNADRNGKFLKLNLNHTEGKVSTTAVWEELGFEIEASKAKSYQYAVDENGKLTNKFDDSGFELKGGLTLKDLVLNGEVSYDAKKNDVKFDFNAGIKVQPSLSMVGSVKGKQIRMGSQNISLGYGFAARIDIYLYVDFNGEISVKPEFTGLVNVKKNAGKSINVTGKCDGKFESEIKCKAKVKWGPDVVINFFGVVDIMDAYAYMGFGADATYNTKNPQKIVVDVYAPTLEAGVSDKESTVLKSCGIKVKIKLIDKEKATFKCPFTAQYTFDVLSKNRNNSQEIQTETESTGENTSGADENTSNGNGTGSDSSGGNGTGSNGNGGANNPPADTYKLSDASYEWATGFGTNSYAIKKNGLYGVVDFNGNVKIPAIYEGVNNVGNNEYEFVKDNVGYVYNVDTCKQIFSYNKIELISNPEDYKVTYIDRGGNEHEMYLGNFTHNSYTTEPNHIIEREYNKGMMLEIITYTNRVTIGDYSSENRHLKYTFKKGNTSEIICSGYTTVESVAFSNIIEEDNAVALECDLVTDKWYINIISKEGVKRKEVSETSPVTENHFFNVYNNGCLKNFGWCEIANLYTGEYIKMPYEPFSITKYYYGRGEYYAVFTDNGSTYDICKGSSIISKGYKFVNFSNDKYIIAGNSSGEAVFMDYSGNVKAAYKDTSEIYNGKALVYDGTGIYYIDEKLNKISDYIYKGKIDSNGCMTMAVKIDGRYCLISQ